MAQQGHHTKISLGFSCLLCLCTYVGPMALVSAIGNKKIIDLAGGVRGETGAFFLRSNPALAKPRGAFQTQGFVLSLS